MLKWYDYLGPLIAFIIFFSGVFIISATCILWICIKPDENVDFPQGWRNIGCCRKKKDDLGKEKP